MSGKKQVSAGAEKAEKLTDDKKTTTSKKSTENVKESATTPAKKSGGRATGKKSSSRATSKKGKIASDKKQRAIKIKQEKKQAHLEKIQERKLLKEERKAARDERRSQLKAERQERRDLLKSESKQERAERRSKEKQLRATAIAEKRRAKAEERQLKREHKLKLKAERRATKESSRRTAGFGGWLAAVISLGVTTLALTTILTYGWMTMNGIQATMYDSQTESVYELNSVIDNLDANLAKARVADSPSDRVQLLTNIAIESEMAEVILERLPVDITMTEEIASFINKMSDSAQDMLYTTAVGGELSASQVKSLDYMYTTNRALKNQLNEIVSNYKRQDLFAAMKRNGSGLDESFTDINNNVIVSPKGIQDGPFADSVKCESAKCLSGLKEITAPAAEKLAKEYFASYNPTAITCTGEAKAKCFTCYNLNVVTDDGEFLAQITKNGGLLVMFDSFKECDKTNYSTQNCIQIAEKFLGELGFENMQAVWTSENGTTCNINFAPVVDGVVIYPDLVKVKVCEERGIVTGMEADSYILNHTDRNLGNATISQSVAQSNISGQLEVKDSRLALIPLRGEEVLAYEFYCEMGGNDYFVYVDAKTGEEIEVLTVVGTAQGRALM